MLKRKNRVQKKVTIQEGRNSLTIEYIKTISFKCSFADINTAMVAFTGKMTLAISAYNTKLISKHRHTFLYQL